MSEGQSGWVRVEWTDEELYFDESTGEPFNEDSRRIIDGIAYDPKFGLRFGSDKIIADSTVGLSIQRAEVLGSAARIVFDERVRPEIEFRASVEIARVLKDPRFDPMPPWHTEAPTESFVVALVGDVDERVLEEMTRSITYDSRFIAAQKKATRRMEVDAAALAARLPQGTRDRLFFSNRIAEREATIAEVIPEAPLRRLSWMAYYAQRHIRAHDEQSTLDRYSIAGKQLVLYGYDRADVKLMLGVSLNKLDQLLTRSASGRLSNEDPLAVAHRALRDASSAPEEMPQIKTAPRAKSVSKLYVAELVELVESTTDPDTLRRIVKRKSVLVAEALLRRHVAAGDLGDEVMEQLPATFPRHHPDMLKAHKERPLPTQTATALAHAEPVAVLDFSDETLGLFDAAGNDRLNVALALRAADEETLEAALARSEADPLFGFLVEMLAARPMRDALRRSPTFARVLVRTADRVLEEKSKAMLRLVACQNADELVRNVERARSTSALGIDPTAFVDAALGGYHERGDGRQDFLQGIAQQIWSAGDLSIEHSLGRAVVERAGTHRAVIRSRGNTYVATPDAIRSYSNTDETVYSHVHLHLTEAVERHVDRRVVVLPTIMPALGVDRELAPHPDVPEGPDVEVMVWRIPLHPAIYTLDEVGHGLAGCFAFADGKVAVDY